jgi:hypothetical protein
MTISGNRARTMDIGFEFDGCLQVGGGLGEALDAAGIDCRVPCADHAVVEASPEGD